MHTAKVFYGVLSFKCDIQKAITSSVNAKRLNCVDTRKWKNDINMTAIQCKMESHAFNIQ